MEKKDITTFEVGMKELRSHSDRMHEGTFRYKENGEKYGRPACTVSPFMNFETYEDILPLEEVPDKPFFEDGDWKTFWSICKKYFPLYSVHGGARNVETILNSEADYVERILNPNLDISDWNDKTVLEIGYGYGATGVKLLRECGADYYGIDFCASKGFLLRKTKGGKYRFFEIEKSGIPDFLMEKKYDVVYSINVMQHLTKAQRADYFKQISECLKDDGKFLFTCFQWNYDRASEVRDDYNTKFFGVKTSIETPDEMLQLLDECGLKVESQDWWFKGDMNGETNVPIYVVMKK